MMCIVEQKGIVHYLCYLEMIESYLSQVESWDTYGIIPILPVPIEMHLYGIERIKCMKFELYGMCERFYISLKEWDAHALEIIARHRQRLSSANSAHSGITKFSLKAKWPK